MHGGLPGGKSTRCTLDRVRGDQSALCHPAPGHVVLGVPLFPRATTPRARRPHPVVNSDHVVRAPPQQRSRRVTPNIPPEVRDLAPLFEPRVICGLGGDHDFLQTLAADPAADLSRQWPLHDGDCRPLRGPSPLTRAPEVALGVVEQGLLEPLVGADIVIVLVEGRLLDRVRPPRSSRS